MSTIKRNTDPLKGPPDGVEVGVNCVVTQFDRVKEKGGSKKKSEKVIKAQAVMPGRVMCAYSEGTLGITIRQIDLMVTLRIDELYEILKAAADASRELEASMPQEYKDAELETRWREMDDVPFDESDESPSGMILAEKWWVFQKGTDREDIWRWFGSKHSKGVEHLLYGGAEEKNGKETGL
jgi:hypothetical protein